MPEDTIIRVALTLALLLGSTARAGDPEVPVDLDALAAQLDQADQDWFTARRGRGARAWRQVLRQARGVEGAQAASLRIRARVRLLYAGTNWTPMVRIGGINKDLVRCPPEQSVCQLAFLDLELLAPKALGGDPQMAVQRLELIADDFPGAEASRRAVLGGALLPVQTQEPEVRDGLGRALVEGAVQPPPPSTVGGGLVADPGMGVGVGLSLVMPDAGRRAVYLSLSGTVAAYGGGGNVYVDTPGTWGVVGYGAGLHTRWWNVGTSTWSPVTFGRLALGPRWQQGPWRIEAGPQLRWDTFLESPGVAPGGHGLWTLVRYDGRQPLEDGRAVGFGVVASADTTVPGVSVYHRASGSAALRLYLPLLGGVLAERVRIEAAWGPDAPTSRMPALGGASLFRGAPPGALRGDLTGLASVEWRRHIWKVFYGAGFADLGLVAKDGGYAGGGLGVRIQPTPRPQDSVRFDVGYSRLGFQVQVGFGEAF